MNSEVKPAVLNELSEQTLRLKRQLMALSVAFIYSSIVVYLYLKGHFRYDTATFVYALVLFWVGNLGITLLIYKGISQKFPDPSMTMTQMLWAVAFLLIGVYTFNDMRSVILMSFFGILSFGFFRLTFTQFVVIAACAIIGYLIVILNLYINEPLRLNLGREFSLLIGFSMTSLILVYTGTSVSRLREANRIKTERLEEALELNTRLATTDDLTGLSTRRYFMEILNKQKAMVEREDSDFVICFADLDHFKYINDSYGHHIGDEVLKIFAGIIRTSIREIDYASRFGGEEFVVLLARTEIKQAMKVAERIRSTIESYNFNDIAPALNVTVSIGLANYKAHHSIQQTLMSADNKMYSAKEQGRNLVVAS
jgi:diguanylate cyclase (GGDEF)-like protein